MDALTLDQFAVFVAVVEEGGFAAAARAMRRAQSAITYAIQKLEEQSGVALFDRSAYRPVLTAEGKALLPRAKRVLEDVADYRLEARAIAKGLEADLSLVLHAYAPPALVTAALGAFAREFRSVQVRAGVDTTVGAVTALETSAADLALVAEMAPLSDAIERDFVARVPLTPVAAPAHPLAQMKGRFAARLLRDHTQIIHAGAGDGARDYGVHAVNRWRVADLDLKHRLVLGGVGWGSMPATHVADDIAAGRLVVLHPDRWEGADRMPTITLVVAHRKDRPLGPAARWLKARFVEEGKVAPPAPRRKRRR